jgi:hypothetical protein
MEFAIGKYAFQSKAQFDSKVENLYTINDEGDKIPDSKFAVVEIGLLEETAPTFDEDGEELTPSIMGTDYHCDMAWYGLEDHPYGWKSYSVEIESEGVHSFAGVNYQENKF